MLLAAAHFQIEFISINSVQLVLFCTVYVLPVGDLFSITAAVTGQQAAIIKLLFIYLFVFNSKLIKMNNFLLNKRKYLSLQMTTEELFETWLY